MKIISMLGFIACTFLIACSTNTKKEIEQNFQVFNPIIKDTLYDREYIAEINAIQNVEIRSRIHGIIEKIHVDEGQIVKQGQPLFTISNSSFQQDLVKAQAMLRSSITELKAVEIELQNTKRLADKNVVSKTELEMLRAKVEIVKAKIEEAKANNLQAKLNLSFTQIKAPFNGIINRIPNKIGSLVDEEALLTSISNDKEVFAYFNVSEIDYLEFAKTKERGKMDQVTLILANNDVYKHKGNIETSESEFDKNTGNIAFRARFINPEHLLKHGSSGKIRINTALKNAMIIPQKSTFEIQENLYVFVVDANNVVKMKRFIPKLRLENFYVVESGLQLNDHILYEGIQLVKDGDKINTQKISASQAFKN
ncbi:efflux RND transporter periplasmic adaptor subunit [Pedobacter puniceum]|uniref:Efflux RND transporter periplasmic adaptor subunit n=1 Tax=Pedobacter puniceum TaxID=2666136 RepID=A0A7K0FSU0_9SPHI|nr:efflux RND transporter periplasmic adaptor subunit [Pedobacter puniceum]MRX48535.1 efflux RND transporter periplasmic adaptor subunit [Pedobacter puniceum]